MPKQENEVNILARHVFKLGLRKAEVESQQT